MSFFSSLFGKGKKGGKLKFDISYRLGDAAEKGNRSEKADAIHKPESVVERPAGTTSWQIGDRIEGRWEVHEILPGGMGIVYVVYDHEFKEVYAAKTFPDKVFTRKPQIAERFRHEAMAWVKIDAHQNVTQAKLVQTIIGKPYLFLEYVSGGDLDKWIGTGRLQGNWEQVLRFGIQFCDGMEHARSHGIVVHRDVKPGNCLVTEDGTLKVTDFGLTKALAGEDFDKTGRGGVESPGGMSGLTMVGSMLGTPAYMAPEQFRDAGGVGVRADVNLGFFRDQKMWYAKSTDQPKCTANTLDQEQ